MRFLRHWRYYAKTYGIYGIVTLAIMAPLLLPGYILTLDLVFTPTMPAPDAVSADYLWKLLLHVLSLILPSEFIEKTILLAIPLVSAIGMHRLLRHSFTYTNNTTLYATWAVYLGSFLFAVNPFTYSRFMAGQYAVLIGYALLPWFLHACVRFVAQPSWRSLWPPVTLATIVSIISIHTIGELAAIALFVLCFGYYAFPATRRALSTYTAMGIIAWIVASSYWLVPLLMGKGSTADTIATFTPADAEAFATIGDSALGKILNVLSLQGFWAEGRELYRLPQDQLPLWGTVRLAVWGVAIYGWITLLRTGRAYTAMLATIGLSGVLIAIGTFQPLLTAIGYREPHKWTGLVALVLAIAFAYGAGRLITNASQRSNLRYSLTAASLGCIVLLLTPTIYVGFGGQLKPRQYPADWYTLDQRLQSEGNPRALFLPWHQYLPLDFAGRTIANPADPFFAAPVIHSHDPELGSIPAPLEQATLDRLIAAKGEEGDAFARELTTQQVRYVILSRDYKNGTYDWLDSQPTLQKVWHTKSVVLYRNTMYNAKEQ